nr:opsin-5-like [Oncorhynchus nerka]
MSQDRLCSLAMLSIEIQLARNLNFKDLISDFASKKAQCWALGVCSLFGNSTLLYVSYKKKRLLKPAEIFIINLAISDMGLTLSLYPMAITSSIYHKYRTPMFTPQSQAYYGLSDPSRSRLFPLFLSLPLSLRWLFGKTVCLIYAFCSVLFGICSLTTLTLLSMVCFVKVCYPLYVLEIPTCAYQNL